MLLREYPAVSMKRVERVGSLLEGAMQVYQLNSSDYRENSNVWSHFKSLIVDMNCCYMSSGYSVT
jgi:hypothetical protein